MAKKPPIIASSEAKDKLIRAAEAAGLSVQELADLVYDSGVVPPPPEDGITQRYTLKDLGTKLWGTLQVTPKEERSEWFTNLLPPQRKAIIVVLRDEGYRTEVIARELGISTQSVIRTWNAYGSELGAQVVGIRLDTIAGQIQGASERAQEMALQAGDHKGFWAVERDKVKALQSLGIVDQAIRKVQVTHKLDDEQKASLERLATLRNKQEKRRIEIEEIKQIEDVGDELPEDIVEDYDDDD